VVPEVVVVEAPMDTPVEHVGNTQTQLLEVQTPVVVVEVLTLKTSVPEKVVLDSLY
jgi:hypothetical protein